VDSIFFSFLSPNLNRSGLGVAVFFIAPMRSRRRVRMPWEGALTQISRSDPKPHRQDRWHDGGGELFWPVLALGLWRFTGGGFRKLIQIVFASRSPHRDELLSFLFSFGRGGSLMSSYTTHPSAERRRAGISIPVHRSLTQTDYAGQGASCGDHFSISKLSAGVALGFSSLPAHAVLGARRRQSASLAPGLDPQFLDVLRRHLRHEKLISHDET